MKALRAARVDEDKIKASMSIPLAEMAERLKQEHAHCLNSLTLQLMRSSGAQDELLGPSLEIAARVTSFLQEHVVDEAKRGHCYNPEFVDQTLQALIPCIDRQKPETVNDRDLEWGVSSLPSSSSRSQENQLSREVACLKAELTDNLARLQEKTVTIEMVSELLASSTLKGHKAIRQDLQEVRQLVRDALRRGKIGFEGGSAIRVHFHAAINAGERLLVIYGDMVEIVSDDRGVEQQIELNHGRWDLQPMEYYQLTACGFPEPWVLTNKSTKVVYKFSSRRGERHHIVSRFRCALGLEAPDLKGLPSSLPAKDVLDGSKCL